MEPDAFKRRMREHEYFHALRLPPGVWAVVRVDGRGFSRLTEAHFEKPFDSRFRDHMVAAATALLTELGGRLVYSQSDEASLLLPPGWNLFDRSVEKLLSVSAGLASAAFTHAAGQPAHFDSRVWIAATAEDVGDYFRWRQADGTRNALNAWGYWLLRRAGMPPAEAERTLDRRSFSEKNELLHQHGVNFNELPAWQRRGFALTWETYEKPGTDPRTGQPAPSTRRRVRVEDDLPVKDAYDAWLRGRITASP